MRREVASGAAENLLPKRRSPKRREISEAERDRAKELLFKMLHSPPSEFGFSRTTWKSTQPQQALRYIGLALSTRDISGVSRGYYDGCRGRTGGPASIVRIQGCLFIVRNSVQHRAKRRNSLASWIVSRYDGMMHPEAQGRPTSVRQDRRWFLMQRLLLRARALLHDATKPLGQAGWVR